MIRRGELAASLFHRGRRSASTSVLILAFISVSCFLTTAGSTRLFAQDQPCDLRTLIVSAFDQKFQLVKGLSADNFRMTLGKKAIPILSVSPAPTPSHMVILFDMSSSMRDPIRTGLVHSAVYRIVNQTPADVSIALLTFAEKTRVSSPFSRDRGPLMEKLKATREIEEPKGRTALLDAISNAIAMLRPAAPGDLILLVSDGGESASHISEAKLRGDLATSGIRLFTLGIVTLQGSRAYSAEEIAGPSTLRELAGLTGGALFFLQFSERTQRLITVLVDLGPFAATDDLDTFLTYAVSRIFQGYRLNVRVPGALKRPERWRLEAEVIENQKRRSIFVSYPEKAFPCAVSPNKP